MLSDSLSPGLREIASFSVSGISIQAFLRTLAETHNLNVQIDPGLNVTLANNFTAVLVKDILYFLCQEYRLDIRFTGTIMSFKKYEAPPVPEPVRIRKHLNIAYDASGGKITFDLQNDSLRAVVKEITRLSGRNVVASGGAEIDGKLISGYIKELPLEGAIDKLAYINGLKATRTKDGVFILEASQLMSAPVMNNYNNMQQPQNMNTQRGYVHQGDIVVQDTLVTLDIVNFPIIEVINQVSAQMGINYMLFSEITGNTTAKVKRVGFTSLLSLLFQGTNYTYKRKQGVYLLGQRTQEGFRTTEVVRLDFRTIEGVEKEIPADLIKEVEVKIQKELNAFIITGNKNRIDEVVSFIRLIDRPVPNILIEVIVAEVSKNFSIETGIKAYISAGDSTVKTGGQLYPNTGASGGSGITISSTSINSLLRKLDDKGIGNLGRVTPNFYATMQALEENNNLQIRSTPKLSTMNGNKANLTIGQSQYYVEQTQNITGGVSPINSITQRFQKVEANMSITISPVVSGNEHITLDIMAEFSNFVAPKVLNAPPGNTTRKFESKIRVRNEEIVVLGGLEEESKSDGGSGVPLLSRIPVLKWIFSYRKKSRSDSRLLIFIKPTVVY